MTQDRTVPFAVEAFDIFQRDLTEAVEPNLVKWNLDTAFYNDKVKPAKLEWDAAYAAWKDPLTRTHEMTVRKDVARENYEELLRKLIGAMKNNVLIPELVLRTLGILTGGGSHEKIPVTDTSPDTTTDTSEPMQVTITTREKGKKSTARPKGGTIWELCFEVADEYTSDISKLTHFSIYTKAKAILKFLQTQRGKILLFAVRWVSPSGEQGKWSVVRMVIIP